ncbi:MAG: hypothetical protein AAGF24_08700 [Cyanobacteria bacterium P01_H01_bin.121]
MLLRRVVGMGLVLSGCLALDANAQIVTPQTDTWQSSSTVAQAAQLPISPAPILAQSFNRPPDGRINPDLPIKITITNAGNTVVEAQLTQPASSERPIAPGRSVSFGTTHTSYLPLPLYMVVNPTVQDLRVDLDIVSTTGNTINLVVREQGGNIPGDRSLSINEAGAIYVF